MSDERKSASTLVDCPVYVIERVEEGLMVECPLCENGFIAHEETWVEGVGDEGQRSTRVCPYCGGEALVVRATRLP